MSPSPARGEVHCGARFEAYLGAEDLVSGRPWINVSRTEAEVRTEMEIVGKGF